MGFLHPCWVHLKSTVPIGRLTLVLLIVAAGHLALLADAEACTCANRDRDRLLAEPDVIFWGVATAVARKEDGALRAIILVKKSYKGGAKGAIEVTTKFGTANCGVDFREDHTYIVFAKRTEDGGYRTSRCMATLRIGAAPPEPLKLPAPRDFSNHRQLLTPVVERAVTDALRTCKTQGELNLTLTIYDNGEFDLLGPTGHCESSSLLGNLTLPKLPEGYAVTLVIRSDAKSKEPKLAFHDGYPRILRDGIREALVRSAPPTAAQDRRLVFEMSAMGNGASSEAYHQACVLWGADAAEDYLLGASRDVTPQLLEKVPEQRLRCLIERGEWSQADEFAAESATAPQLAFLSDIVKRVRPFAMKGLPIQAGLADLGVKPTDLLRYARTVEGWEDDLLFLDLLGKALLLRPHATPADRELAAKVYARAALISSNHRAGYRAQAVAWGGEELVASFERDFRNRLDEDRERYREIREYGLKKGYPLPTTPTE